MAEGKKQTGWHVPTEGSRAGKKSRCQNIYNCGLKDSATTLHFENEGDATIAVEDFESKRVEKSGVNRLDGLKKVAKTQTKADVPVVVEPDFDGREKRIKSDIGKKTKEIEELKDKINNTEFNGNFNELKEFNKKVEGWKKELSRLHTDVEWNQRGLEYIKYERELYKERFPTNLPPKAHDYILGIANNYSEGDELPHEYQEYAELAKEIWEPENPNEMPDFGVDRADVAASVAEFEYKRDLVQDELDKPIVVNAGNADEMAAQIARGQELEKEYKKYDSLMSRVAMRYRDLEVEEECYKENTYPVPNSVHKALYGKAYREGHAYGYYEIKNHYIALAEFAWSINSLKD